MWADKIQLSGPGTHGKKCWTHWSAYYCFFVIFWCCYSLTEFNDLLALHEMCSLSKEIQ